MRDRMYDSGKAARPHERFFAGWTKIPDGYSPFPPKHLNQLVLSSKCQSCESLVEVSQRKDGVARKPNSSFCISFQAVNL